MEHVYLGFFADLLEMVFENIIQPIIEFLASVLSKILSWVFDNVMKPMLISIVWPTVKAIAELIMDVISTFLFDLVSLLYKCIEYVLKFFEIFSGISDVTYDGKSMPFLNVLFVSPTIQRGTWAIISISFVLLLVFSIAAVVHSMGESGGELNRPVSKVLQSTMKAFIRMMLIPFTCLFLISVSGTVIRSVYNGMKAVNSEQTQLSGDVSGSSTTIPRVLFCLTTLNAANSPTYNISGGDTSKIALNDALRAPYYFEDYADKNNGKAKDYTDRDVVSADFNYKDIDYSLGIPLALSMLFILIVCVIKFIERIFNILILFVISPIFSSTMPLDDGKRYDTWKEAFIGQLFMGFGSIVSMQIYLLLIPPLMDSKLSFGKGTVEANALIRVILLFGGAYAVHSAGTLITGILSSSAASTERSAQAHGAMVAQRAGSMAMGAARYAGGMAVRGVAGLGSKLKPEPYKSKKELQEEKEAALAKTGKTKDGGYANKQPKKDQLDQRKYLGGLITRTTDKDGKTHTGINFGKHMRIGYRKDGTYKVNVFGLSMKYGKDGKLESMGSPFIKYKRSDDGQMHCSKFNAYGIIKFRAKEDVYKDKDGNEHTHVGDMYMSDFSPLGIQRSYDQDEGKVHTDSVSLFGKSLYERLPEEKDDKKE
ncbi:MAG: hypothetical protein K6B44_06070 [Lachnospiraceae bacterium]|nr:hypothetical protein [Lachnospiraceae bacterium]